MTDIVKALEFCADWFDSRGYERKEVLRDGGKIAHKALDQARKDRAFMEAFDNTKIHAGVFGSIVIDADDWDKLMQVWKERQ